MKHKQLTLNEKRQVLERQHLKCGYCKRIVTLTANRLRDWKKELGYYPDKSVPSRARFHHLLKVSDGGSNNLSNIVALCGRCHGKAHDYYRRYKS